MNVTTAHNGYLTINKPSILSQATIISLDGSTSLSECYSYILHIESQRQLLSSTLLNSSISLTIDNNQFQQPIHGIISKVEQEAHAKHYKIHIAPELIRCHSALHSRIFTNLSIPKIVSSILLYYPNIKVNFSRLKNDYPCINYITQYQESDFTFINRILADAGIAYYFIHGKTHTQCMLSDNYLTTPLSDTIFSHVMHQNTVAPYLSDMSHQSGVTANSLEYFYYEPNQASDIIEASIDYSNNSVMPWFEQLEKKHYCSDVTTPYALTLLQSHQQREYNKKNYQSAKTNVCTVYAGMRIKSSQNTYQVINSRIKINQRKKFLHRLILADANTNTITTKSHQKPRINDIQPAIVIGHKNTVYSNNADAAIKIQFLWDENASGKMNQTRWVRVLQAISGAHWGSQFLPAVGQKVMVGFIGGDIDQPMVIGAYYENASWLPHPKQATLISGIKGDQGSELQFNDAAPSPSITIMSQKDYLVSVDNYAFEHILGNQIIKTKKGNFHIHAKKGEVTLKSQNSIEFNVANSLLKISPDRINLCAPQISINSSNKKSMTSSETVSTNKLLAINLPL